MRNSAEALASRNRPNCGKSFPQKRQRRDHRYRLAATGCSLEELAVERAEVEAGRERMYLEWARHGFAAYRSVARLLGGEERLAA
jgi:hypothetical protein